MSDALSDRKFYTGFGVIMSVEHADVERIRAAIQECGGKIVFQTISTGALYLLRQRQVEEILSGDLTQLRELYEKKQKERRLEKK